MWPGPRRVAVVGGGPAGLSAAIALIQNTICSAPDDLTHEFEQVHKLSLPKLVLSISEKRTDPIRRQHVYLGFDRLECEAHKALKMDLARLENLLQTHGATAELGSSLELRTLELCLQILLKEVADQATSDVVVRWFPRSFSPADVAQFDDVIGSDGRRSAVRQLLMARIPKVQLAQRALEIEFAYSCDLEWQAHEGVHTLKQQRYAAWQPCLLYQKLSNRQAPEYVQISHSNFNIIVTVFQQLIKDGRKPFTTPFASTQSFLALFAAAPEVRASLGQAFRAQVEDFHEEDMVLITPVEQTLHRAPFLVSSSGDAWSKQSLWLFGDAAVGLPVSKGCNLIYHMASAGKLASALLGEDAAHYEQFVFANWNREAWRERAKHTRGLICNRPACFSYGEGRFTR